MRWWRRHREPACPAESTVAVDSLRELAERIREDAARLSADARKVRRLTNGRATR